ncbi:MAG TPA: AMP-binding protein [Streptosporangiaceae bacterium]|nr:AMP-binding protein [Streptosporangiaceae bacterium]
MAGTTFLSVLGRLAEADPERPALTCEGVTSSRAEFAERVERLAGLFARHGVAEGSTVTIGLPNSAGLVESLFAVWALGAVPQPISGRLPPLERAAIVDLARPALVVGVPQSEVAGWPALESLPGQLPSSAFTPGVSPMWKLVTSGGSTGRPKLIAAAEPALFENVGGAGHQLLRMRPDGCVLVTGPISHNAPLSATAAGMLLGNHVVVMPRFDPADTLRLIETHRVDWVYLVPTMMLRIWRLPSPARLAADVSCLQVAFHMAAPCPPWLKQAWIDWLGPEKILELYGGTELQAMTVITGTEWLAHRGSVGRPVIGEIQIRDSDGQPVLAGQEGEIWMRRGENAPAAYRYIGATARTAADGWESLGDIGFLDADGYVYVTDRLQDMILVGGANVYPAEIEAALDEHPAVQSCCVIGVPDEDLGNIPHAIVELSQPVSDEDLMAHLRLRLAPHKLPRVIERTTAPLRDDAGKVRRSALRAERVSAGKAGAG